MRSFLLAALLSATALPALAFDPAAMSDAEKEAFGQAVRAYLLENPEVLQEVVSELETRQQAQQASSDTEMVKTYADALFEDPNSWVSGNPDGDIVVVEFMDYRCGYCRKAYDEVEELIKSDGKIRFIVKEYPILGEESELSARFAIAVRQIAGDQAYEAAHDALITFRGDVTADSLARLASDLGVDPNAVLTRMTAPEVEAVLAANEALGKQMQISGTPTFVVGGQMLRGYVPLDGMRQIVSEERGG
jgi:protein-disulfide isomerase